MANVMVTGGAGDIGFYLVRLLLDRGDRVWVVENFSRGRQDEAFGALLDNPNASLLEGDLCDPAFVAGLPEEVEYVYHFAAVNGTANFYERPFTVLENCTVPTILLLKRYAGHGGIRRFVYAGSSEAYASTVSRFDWPVPTAENVPLCIEDPTNVRWSYGGSKMHGELAAFAAAKQYGIPVMVVRFHNSYGPRMNDKHVIPDFIARARRGVYELYGYKDTRSFLFVTDSVRACVMAAESDNIKDEVIHIGGEPEISMLDLGKMILRLMGKGGEEIALYPSPAGSVNRRCPDLGKLRAATGFKPLVSLEDGIKTVLEQWSGESSR